MVQRNAMRTWDEGVPLLAACLADEELLTHLTAAQIEAVFDLDAHLGQVDTIFERVFGPS